MRLLLYKIFSLLLLIFTSEFFAQNKIDSLKNNLQHAGNDTATVGIINVLTYALYINNGAKENEISMYIDSAIRVAVRTNYASGNIKARFIAGNIYKNSGQTTRAEQYLLGAIPYCKQTNNTGDYFKINHTLGLCFDEEGSTNLEPGYGFGLGFCILAL